jgi:hypothetical protein
MRHAKKAPAHKRLTTYAVGLSLVAVTGLCIGGLTVDRPETPEKAEVRVQGPDVPGPSDEAPKTAEEGQARKNQTAGSVSEPQNPENRAESRPTAPAEADATKPPTTAEKGSQGQEKPSSESPVKGVTATPTPGEPTASPEETDRPRTPPKAKPEKPVYQFFIADDSEQNRTWCDVNPSGSVKVEIGTMYASHYNDKDPKKAYADWRVSKEDTTCP